MDEAEPHGLPRRGALLDRYWHRDHRCRTRLGRVIRCDRRERRRRDRRDGWRDGTRRLDGWRWRLRCAILDRRRRDDRCAGSSAHRCAARRDAARWIARRRCGCNSRSLGLRRWCRHSPFSDRRSTERLVRRQRHRRSHWPCREGGWRGRRLLRRLGVAGPSRIRSTKGDDRTGSGGRQRLERVERALERRLDELKRLLEP